MKTKRILVITVLMIASMLFTACQPAAPTQAPAPTLEEVVPTSPPTTEPVKLTLYSVAWMSTHQAMLNQLIEKFNEEYSGRIEVEYIQGDWGEVENYLTAGVAGGGGIADLIEGGTDIGLGWYNQGFLTDLTPYITDEIRATMPDELWASRTAADGAVFMSGTVTGNHILVFYNPALLEAAGVEPSTPDNLWTWDDLIANATILTVDASGKHLGEAGFDAQNVVQWGFMPRLDNEKVWEEAGAFCLQATGLPIIRRGDDGSWDAFFDEGCLPVLKAYTDLVKLGVTSPMAVGLSGDSQNELFNQGQAAMILRGYFNVSVLEGLYPDFDFNVMPIPMSAENKFYYTDNLGQGYSIPVTSTHPAEAAEFMFWLQQPEQQAMHSSSLGMAPVNTAALQDPVLMDNPRWDTMRFYKSIEKLIAPEYNTNTWEWVTTVYAPPLMQVIMGEKDFDVAIDEIKTGGKDILNQ